MDNVIDLKAMREMRKALDEADASDEQPRMLAYTDINGMPQTVVEGESITQQQVDNMPDEIYNLLVLAEE